MKREEFFKGYWNGYKLIEERFMETRRFVSVEKDNYAAYSDEYIDIFLLTCSELDSVITQYCRLNSEIPFKEVKMMSIFDRFKLIKPVLKNIKDYKVKTVPMFSKITLAPFAKIVDADGKPDTPDWWKSYNHVKHERTEKDGNGRYYYEAANLKNTLHALSALYIMIYKLHEILEDAEAPETDIPSKLFIPVMLTD